MKSLAKTLSECVSYDVRAESRRIDVWSRGIADGERSSLPTLMGYGGRRLRYPS